jgi:putative ABC transport system permease protein
MTSIMTVLVVALSICLLIVAWIALRRPVMFKLGVRNLPKRPAQTVLVIIGLMLSTLIIAAALGTGDTIDHSITALTYDTLGEVDELVVYSQDEDSEGSINAVLMERIPESVTNEVRDLFVGTDLVDGVMSGLIQMVPVYLLEGDPPPPDTNWIQFAQDGGIAQAEPEALIIGIEPDRIEEFGGLRTVDGEPIDFAALSGDEVVLSENMAAGLGASVGDTIGFTFGNEPIFLTIAHIAVDSPLSGEVSTDMPGLSMPLARMQELTDSQGEITMVMVSNTGGVRDGVELTDEVTAMLRDAFADRDIGVHAIKQDLLEIATQASSIFTTFFLIFGLFSIAVGILLIVLIFAMLAAERRPEMGMARAVGAQRAQLVQSFVSEGTVYALLAGLVGVALGVLATFAIAAAIGPAFGGDFDIDATVSPRSMIVAYCLGVVITFLAVVVSSWRISRLNIVAAVRDIPDFTTPVRKLRTVIWAALLLVVGALLTATGLANDSAFPALLGLSLLPFGIAMILRYVGVPSRPVFSLVGIYLLVIWLLPEEESERIFGPLAGDIEMFFLSGIFLVAGSTIIIVQNLDVLLAILTRVGGVFRSALPSIRMAVAFPGQVPSRTGMTIAMFSLIIFSLVTFATINDNFVNIFLGDDANAGWDVRADQGQANFIGSAEDFVALLDQRGVDTETFEAIGMGRTTFQTKLRRPGGEWGFYMSHAIDDNLIDESDLFFQQRAEGYPDDGSIIEALLTRDDVAVIDSFALAGAEFFGGAPNQFTLEDPDGDGPEQAITSGMHDFPPVTVEIEGTAGETRTFEIIGIIDSKIGSFFGLFAPQEPLLSVLPNPPLTSYFVQLSDPGQSVEVSQQIERALIVDGVQTVSIRAELEDAQEQNRLFLYIIQGFMGLGLIVGLAAVGVISFRAVVERRQQIGVLRAIGFQRRMVALSFLIESGFVVALGAISGTILGLLLARLLFATEDFAPSGTDFVIPWTLILVMLAITFVAALIMTLIPARQASNLAPAEALRYE